MLFKPIGLFLIAISLFAIVFWVLSYNVFGLPHMTIYWLSHICLGTSVIFALFSLILGIRRVVKKRKGLIYNLIAIIGSAIILTTVGFIVHALFSLV